MKAAKHMTSKIISMLLSFFFGLPVHSSIVFCDNCIVSTLKGIKKPQQIVFNCTVHAWLPKI